MRDLLFKNLTSTDKKRKIISSSETSEAHGVRSIIQRHFICLAKEVSAAEEPEAPQHMYVLKSRDTKRQKERFFCKIKGSLYTVHQERLYLLRFMHSLKINLVALPA